MTGFLAAFAGDRRGVAGLEFAMVASAMIALCVGIFEVSQAYRAATRLKGAAEAVAELVAMRTGVTGDDIGDICAAGRIMMRPFHTGGLGFEIASILILEDGEGSIGWRSDLCAANGTTNPEEVVAGIGLDAGENAVVVRATYLYRSPLLFFLPEPITLRGDAIARPRKDAVGWSAS